MKTKKSVIGMLVMAFVFGIASVGSLAAQTDAKLNGTWVSSEDGTDVEIKLRNGNYEQSIAGVSLDKGTYKASKGVFTMNTTHIHGEYFNLILGGNYFDPKWYTMKEFLAAYRNIFQEIGVPEEQIEEITNEITKIYNYSYTVDAKKLVLSTTEGEKSSVEYFKK